MPAGVHACSRFHCPPRARAPHPTHPTAPTAHPSIPSPTLHARLSKAAANMAAQLLALELQAQGIPLVAIHPGAVATDMHAQVGAPFSAPSFCFLAAPAALMCPDPLLDWVEGWARFCSPPAAPNPHSACAPQPKRHARAHVIPHVAPPMPNVVLPLSLACTCRCSTGQQWRQGVQLARRAWRPRLTVPSACRMQRLVCWRGWMSCSWAAPDGLCKRRRERSCRGDMTLDAGTLCSVNECCSFMTWVLDPTLVITMFH